MKYRTIITLLLATTGLSANAQQSSLDRLTQELDTLVQQAPSANLPPSLEALRQTPLQSAPSPAGIADAASDLGGLGGAPTLDEALNLVPEGFTGRTGKVQLGTIARGTVNLTSVSDYPGPWRGTLSTPIYAANGLDIIAPAGATVVGFTTPLGGPNAIIQNRLSYTPLAVSFDGRVIPLEGQFIVDAEGISGIRDKVKYHFKTIAAAGLAGGVLDALPEVLENAIGTEDNVQQVFGNVSNVSTQLLNRYLALVPTIKVRAGTQFQILFMREIEAPVYRTQERYQFVSEAP